MTGLPLDQLPPARQADVLAALAALAAVETADSPVAGQGFRALQDPPCGRPCPGAWPRRAGS